MRASLVFVEGSCKPLALSNINQALTQMRRYKREGYGMEISAALISCSGSDMAALHVVVVVVVGRLEFDIDHWLIQW